MSCTIFLNASLRRPTRAPFRKFVSLASGAALAAGIRRTSRSQSAKAATAILCLNRFRPREGLQRPVFKPRPDGAMPHHDALWRPLTGETVGSERVPP